MALSPPKEYQIGQIYFLQYMSYTGSTVKLIFKVTSKNAAVIRYKVIASNCPERFRCGKYNKFARYSLMAASRSRKLTNEELTELLLTI